MATRVFFLLAAFLATVCADGEAHSGVIDLGSDTFGTVRLQPTFVKFYAPWCGHCQHLAPTWSELAQEFENKGVKIAKVDCTQHGSICDQNGVQGYPTLVLFHDGETTLYSGGRTLQALSKFVNEQLAPLDEPATSHQIAVPENGLYVATDSNFQDLISKGVAFVKFFAPWCGHCKHLAPTWETLAGNYKGNEHVKIIHADCTTQPNLCQSHGIRGYPTLQAFVKGQKTSSPYNGQRTLEALSKYVDENLQTLNQHEAHAEHDGDL